jgi:hypothetical protein
MRVLGGAACLLLLLATEGLGADKKPPLPEAGQEFVLAPEFPKHLTCNIDFRDPADKLWPNFVGGRGIGRIVYDPAKPQGEFTVTFDRLNQKDGEQSRRVLGELIHADQPFIVVLAVQSVGAFKEETIEEPDGKGKTRSRTALLSTLSGTLDVAGRKTPFEAKAQVKANASKDSEKVESLFLELRWTIQGKDLGLKAEGATGPIEVFAGLAAYAPRPAQKKGK